LGEARRSQRFEQRREKQSIMSVDIKQENIFITPVFRIAAEKTLEGREVPFDVAAIFNSPQQRYVLLRTKPALRPFTTKSFRVSIFSSLGSFFFLIMIFFGVCAHYSD